ncbi:MAG: PAS domain S-box protein [Bacteroidetes bacterium]|nr:PAS domain S-box protein [Bacteroidota bacterium]
MKKTEKKTVTILIIDDKRANIFVLEKLLEKKERTFLTATSGKEGLTIALNKEIDLIILDVQMPGMDGFEVAQILKSNKQTKDIPIIFASAEKKEHASMVKGFDEGAIDYLFKPLDPEITKAKVAVLLQIQLQRKELLEKNISLEKAALLINNSADIIGVIDPMTLKFEEINQAFSSILGYPIEEAKGTAVTFFLHSEDRALIQNMVKQEKEKLSFETRVYCKDRTIKWLHWHVIVRTGKWFINARDITEIKQVEKITNYLATTVKQSNDAVYIHNSEGKIISWNEGAERIYGYKESEALKMKIWNIIPEYMLPETQQIFNQIIEGKKVEFQETKRVTKHGKIIDVLFSASVIIDSSDQQKSITITEKDVTQQKLADEKILQLNAHLQRNVTQLESINKELESFSYSVSHDLRAPLRALSGHSVILLEDYGDKFDDEAKRLLESIQGSVHKMNNLIDNLLRLSKLGRQEIIKSEIDVSKLVVNVVNEIKGSIPHNANINLNPLPPICADHSLLTQVWINLISNAIKYSSKKENSQVEVGCDKMESEIVYYVKDNGAGFDMKYADKLFGVFQRLHKATEFEGTGVGLAIVQRIVTKHGGRVWAEGKVDGGATFYFSLPF